MKKTADGRERDSRSSDPIGRYWNYMPRLGG